MAVSGRTAADLATRQELLHARPSHTRVLHMRAAPGCLAGGGFLVRHPHLGFGRLGGVEVGAVWRTPRSLGETQCSLRSDLPSDYHVEH